MSAAPLELLFLYDCVYPESLGGVEHRNDQLARQLGRRGHRVTIAGFTGEPRRLASGARVRSLGPARGLYTAAGRRSLRQAVRFAAACMKIELEPFDVVETANIPFAHLFGLAARCRRAGKPLLVTWYEYWGRYWRDYVGPLTWRAYAAVERRAARLGTATLAVSSITARRLARHRRGASHTLPIGIDVAAVRGAAAEAGAGGPPLIYAGRLLPEKRVDLLLEAVARLPFPADGGPLLRVIGDGPDRARLERLAAGPELAARVVFDGRLETSRDVWAAMAGAAVAVQPSRREGFGLFPLEAMALGLPVVHCESTESAVEELVRDGREGLRSAAEPGELAAVLGRLLAEPAERRHLGEAARRRAEEYDWERVAGRLEALLEELTADGRRHPAT